MATFQLLFQSGRAKDLSAPLYFTSKQLLVFAPKIYFEEQYTTKDSWKYLAATTYAKKKNRYFSPIPFCSRRAAEKTGRGESGQIQEREEKMQCLQYYITPHHLPSDKCQVYLRKCKGL